MSGGDTLRIFRVGSGGIKTEEIRIVKCNRGVETEGGEGVFTAANSM